MLHAEFEHATIKAKGEEPIPSVFASDRPGWPIISEIYRLLRFPRELMATLERNLEGITANYFSPSPRRSILERTDGDSEIGANSSKK